MTGLSEKTIDFIKNVFKKYPEIEIVKIFGSRAMGNYKHNSDIDLALFVKEINDDLEAKVLFELEDLPMPYKFDVKFYENITNENLKKHIDDYGEIFYEKGVS